MVVGQKGCGERAPAPERNKGWPWACVAAHPSAGRASGRAGYAVGDKNQGAGSLSPALVGSPVSRRASGCDEWAVPPAPSGGKKYHAGPID